jgi:large subunit ribosomal protein L10
MDNNNNNRRIEKIQLCEYISDLIKNSSYLYFISYFGINVAEFSGFRSKLDSVGCDCKVLKNSFIHLGLGSNDIALPNGFQFTGDTAVIIGDGDPAVGAKVIAEFNRNFNQVQFKGGLIDGDFIDAKEAKSIADLPPREILLPQLLGLLQAPAISLVRVLNASGSGIVNALNAHANKLEEEA